MISDSLICHQQRKKLVVVLDKSQKSDRFSHHHRLRNFASFQCSLRWQQEARKTTLSDMGKCSIIYSFATRHALKFMA